MLHKELIDVEKQQKKNLNVLKLYQTMDAINGFLFPVEILFY